jgi:hypothetical protein
VSRGRTSGETLGGKNTRQLEQAAARKVQEPAKAPDLPFSPPSVSPARFRMAVGGGVEVTVFSRDHGYLGLMTLRFDNREYPRTRSFRILEPRALSAQVSSRSRTRVLHRALHTRRTRISSCSFTRQADARAFPEISSSGTLYGTVAQKL